MGVEGKNTRAKILESARKLFSLHGFDGTGIDRIARSAEVNKSLIYYHFPDKNGILEELFTRFLLELQEFIQDESIRDPNGGRGARDRFSAEVSFWDSHRDMAAIILVEAVKGGAAEKILLDCADKILRYRNDMHGNTGEFGKEIGHPKAARQFFKEFLPIITYAVFNRHWSEHVLCSTNELHEYLLDSLSG